MRYKMTTFLLKHKVFESRMIVRLWLYDSFTKTAYTEDVEIEDSFLE